MSNLWTWLKRVSLLGALTGLPTAVLIGAITILDGVGDFKLMLFYAISIPLIFTVIYMLLSLYGELIRLKPSSSNHVYLFTALLWSFSLLFATSYAFKFFIASGKGAEFYSFPRNISFILAVLSFFWFSKNPKKIFRVFVFMSTFVLIGCWLMISVTGGFKLQGGLAFPKKESPNILLLTIESLRYDHLGITSDSRVKSETLDDLSEKGIFFDNYFVQAPYTTTSLCTLMTGMYPFHHGARAFGEIPDAKHQPFVKTLAENGYLIIVDSTFFEDLFTTGHQYISRRSFTAYIHDIATSLLYVGNCYLGKLFPSFLGRYCFSHSTSIIRTSRLLRNIRVHKGQTWLFWTHFVANCHWPYKSPSHFTKMYSQEKEPFKPEFSKADIEKLNANPEMQDKKTLRQIDLAYSAEVSAIDRQIRMIVDLLRRLDLLDNTIIILSADHGESLGEEQYIGHGNSLKDHLVHVPLILYSANKQYLAERTTRHELIEEVDIAPTVLDMCGLEYRLEDFDGKSILNLLQKNEWNKKSVYSEFTTWDRKNFYASLRTRESKLVWDARRNSFSLYSLAEDPSEETDVSLVDPRTTEALKMKLLALTGKSDPIDLEPDVKKKLVKRVEEKMRALGYIK